ncbi:DUF3889 domain-containing protein [bacterium LRH843]|nr:DUF3889 domain-containing protein [bacterium LRH843]
MRKALILACCWVISFGYVMSVPSAHPPVHAENGIPSYAKWGKLAMEKTKEKYPNAKIIDYLHIGSEKTTKTTIEKFKLWLKVNNKEFGVFVDIEFNTETEDVLSIHFKESARVKEH